MDALVRMAEKVPWGWPCSGKGRGGWPVLQALPCLLNISEFPPPAVLSCPLPPGINLRTPLFCDLWTYLFPSLPPPRSPRVVAGEGKQRQGRAGKSQTRLTREGSLFSVWALGGHVEAQPHSGHRAPSFVVGFQSRLGKKWRSRSQDDSGGSEIPNSLIPNTTLFPQIRIPLSLCFTVGGWSWGHQIRGVTGTNRGFYTAVARALLPIDPCPTLISLCGPFPGAGVSLTDA